MYTYIKLPNFLSDEHVNEDNDEGQIHISLKEETELVRDDPLEKVCKYKNLNLIM